jgi:probable rRNA maturation factor
VPVITLEEDFPLAAEELTALWNEVTGKYGHVDDYVSVACVDVAEMRRLNKRYRGKDADTNVLTFSYRQDSRKTLPYDEHDVVLCLPVAKREASERGEVLNRYLAWLLVHAFLHAVGMDHEQSADGAKQMHRAESDILAHCGF